MIPRYFPQGIPACTVSVMKGKTGASVLLAVYCINMFLVELPRLFLSVGMMLEGYLREGTVMTGVFVLSTLGLVGVAFGKWKLMSVGLMSHATVAATGLVAIAYRDFVPGFLASTVCSISILVCSVMPSVISYIASGNSVVDSD